MDRVVPVAVEAMPLEAHGRELRVGHGDTAGILSAVAFRPDAQARPAVGGPDETDDRREVDERRAPAVHGDVREQAVLDLVPLTGAGREVTHGNREPGARGQLLEFPFPEAQAAPLLPPASAVITRDRAWRYAGRPMCRHHRWIDCTAKVAVS